MTGELTPVSLPEGYMPAGAAQPQNTQPTEGDEGLLEQAGEVIADIPQGVVNGLVNAGHSVADLQADVMNLPIRGYEAITGQEEPGFRFRAPEPANFETGVVGNVADGATRFAVGYATGANLLRTLGWAVKGKKALDGARALTAGAFSDATMFTGDEGRLADFLSQYPAFEKLVPDYLETDMDDGEFEKRFKNMLEGGALGVGMDAALASIKGMKQVRGLLNAGKTDEALQVAVENKMKVADVVHRAAKNNDGKIFRIEVDETDPAEIVFSLKDVAPEKEITELGEVTRNAQINVEKTSDGFQVLSSSLPESLRGTGLGKSLYKDIVDYSIEKGGVLHSDSSVSESAINVYRKLADEGYGVVFNENVEKNGKQWMSLDGSPVVTVKTKPTNTAKPIVKIGQKERAALVGNLKERLNETGDLYRSLDEADFNFEKFGLDDDPVQVIQAVSDVLKDEVDAVTGGVRNFDKVIRDAADYVGLDVDTFTDQMARTFSTSERLDSKIVAMKAVVGKYAKDIDELAKGLDTNPADPELQKQLGKAWQRLAELQLTFKGTQTNVARALNAQKIIPGESLSKAFDDLELEKLAKGELDPEKVRILTDRLKYVEGKPHAASRIVRHGFGRAVDLHNEYWQNAILSGPGTQEIAFVSNAMKTLSMDVERIVAGVSTGNMELAREGVDMIVGQVLNMREAGRMMLKSFKNERNFGDPENLIDDVLPSRLIRKGDGKFLGNGFDGFVVNSMGRIINAPRHALGASDEFFKTMNYRANIRAKALREARQRGFDADQTADLVQRRLAASITEDGRFLDKEGLEFARESTFTTDLGEGTIGQSVQSLVANHPTLRVFAPFVRTPVNLFREVWRRTPVIGKYQFQQRQMLAAGGEKAAIAKAQIATGYTMYGLAALGVMQGKVTGKAPSDPGLRDMWFSEGKKEYSVNLGTEEKPNWVPYRKLDPFGSFLGLVADGVQISGELDTKDWEKTIPVIIGSISSNIASKAFLSDTIDKLDALVSGEGWKLDRELRSHFGSYMPNAVRQVNGDQYMREARSYMDHLMRGIRGYSETMAPRRNAFGQPLTTDSVPYRIFNPFVGRKEANDPVYEALMDLGKGVPPLPTTIANGRINLEDDKLANEEGKLPFDRWAELMAEPIGGTSLYDEMKSLVTSRDWEELSNNTDEYASESSKYKAALSLVQTYRKAQFNQMLQEFPKLRQALEVDNENKRRAFIGEEVLPLQ
jgi:hypothetical protein